MDALFRFSPIKTESLTELKRFLTAFRENIAAINALGVNDLSGFLLFYIASRVLDLTTRQTFEFEYRNTEILTFDVSAEFVQVRCRVLQNSMSFSKSNEGHKGQSKTNFSLIVSSSSDAMSCLLCKVNHALFQCSKFTQQTVQQRFRLARTNRLCMNCLGASHKTLDCKSTHMCRHCASKHHSLLHMDNRMLKNSCVTNGSVDDNWSKSIPSTSQGSDKTGMTDLASLEGTSCSQTNVLLGTAIARIRDNCGKLIDVRVLIDTGSQISLITTACVSKLGIKRRHCKTEITGLSQTSVLTTKGPISCTLVPHDSTTPEIYCEPVILSKISGVMPNVLLTSKIRGAYAHLHFADPHFVVPSQIDFLLGADIYPFILGKSCKVLHNPHIPSAFETLLGWLILGRTSADSQSPRFSLMLAREFSVDHLIQSFWDVEEPTPKNNLFTTDQQCEDHFRRTTLEMKTAVLS